MREVGLDTGGLAKEFFEIFTKAVLDPSFGLFKTSTDDRSRSEVVDSSESLTDERRLYYKLLGKLMGKLIVYHHTMPAHFENHIYKHMVFDMHIFTTHNMISYIFRS